MRRIINSTYITLDGVMEHLEQWHFDYVDDETNAFVSEQLLGSDALLMGRRSYEGHAEAWPSRTGDPADKFNAMRKYVASTTLRDPEWNNTVVLQGDLVEEVRKLKDEPGEDILMYGFGPVGATLLEHGLLDELVLWVHPVMVGIGEPGDLLFRAGTSAKFELAGTRAFGAGVVILTYRPTG